MKSKLIETLNQLLDRQSISKNGIIRETGIDRSTFFKILKGDRIPTEAQLTGILSSVSVDQETLHSIIRQFVLEKQSLSERDFNIFHRWMEKLSVETSRHCPKGKTADKNSLKKSKTHSLDPIFGDFLAASKGSRLMAMMPASLLINGSISSATISRFNSYIEEDSSAVPSTRNFCLFPIDGVETLCAFPAWDESFIIRITDPEITKAFEGWYHAMWQISAMTRVIRATQAG